MQLAPHAESEAQTEQVPDVHSLFDAQEFALQTHDVPLQLGVWPAQVWQLAPQCWAVLQSVQVPLSHHSPPSQWESMTHSIHLPLPSHVRPAAVQSVQVSPQRASLLQS